MAKPDTIYLFRIIHADNLDFILESGKLTCPNHDDSDPNYIGIGDFTLIESRSSRQVMVAPHGNFNDYVSFYFGMRSPMLYNIQKGYNNVTQRKPEEIVYLVTTFNRIKENDSSFVFTDGHGYHLMSQFFNKEEDLSEVDWDAVQLKIWNDTEDDPDRKRRKQAEFLVYKELSVLLLHAIVVYSNEVKAIIEDKLQSHHHSCRVYVRPSWYY